MTAPASDATGIVVRTRIIPLAFLLLLFKTNVAIDGFDTVQSWGPTSSRPPPAATR
jgi:hypothetical protein